VENCFTRLRVDVRDPALIQQTLLKESGGSSVLIKGNHVQVIYGLGLTKFERRSTPVWVLLNNEVVNER
jgi:PTS system arbutin-like IIC component